MKFALSTAHPVAVDSLDHRYPFGTAADNSVNLDFNRKLFELFEGPVSVLDLGCSGGGFVKSVLDAGHIAVGLEGSDYSFQRQRAEWATIPDSLFTCDVTRPFTLHAGDRLPYRFDVVTAWEFFEHIEEPDLRGVAANIRNHLILGGLLICSTTEMSSPHPAHSGIELHRTRRPAPWWVQLFAYLGFERRPDLERHFGRDWVRNVQYNFVFEKV